MKLQFVNNINLQTMKLLSIILGVTLLTVFSTKEKRSDYYANGQLKYEAETINGLLNGYYTYWYENGKKKAEGHFNYNQRVGDWKVWDASGRLKTTRNYKNNFDFEILQLFNKDGKNIELPSVQKYSLKKNRLGFIAYPETKQENVYVERKTWRTIPNSAFNAALLDETILNVMVDKAKNKEILVYDANSDDLDFALNSEQRNKITIKDCEIVAYNLKEVWFFDESRKLAETRILGICPVVKNKKTGKEKDLFWVPYDKVRKYFAGIAVDKKMLPEINTLEDVLHFRQFNSQIYKETNVFDRKIIDYTPSDRIEKEAIRIEMDLLNREHDLWVQENL